MTLAIRVLGAAAGGGVPQWNCGCANCAAARAGRIPRMTQSSLAVSADGAAWALVNASPDIGEQLLAAPALHPRAPRHSPIGAVLVTNADVDHVAGLLTLREGQPFDLVATPEVLAALDANPLFGVLRPEVVRRRPAPLGAPFQLLPGLEAEFFAVPGKVALWREGAGDGPIDTRAVGEWTVGVTLRAGGRTAHAIPGCAAMTPDLAARLRGAALVLFDGTVWSDDEMRARGLGAKTGARMGHMAMDGPEGSLAAFAPLGVARKVFVHVNNSNPVLDPASPERAALAAAGWEVAFDGMELSP